MADDADPVDTFLAETGQLFLSPADYLVLQSWDGFPRQIVSRAVREAVERATPQARRRMKLAYCDCYVREAVESYRRAVGPSRGGVTPSVGWLETVPVEARAGVEERAAIREYDGGYRRMDAECLAIAAWESARIGK